MRFLHSQGTYIFWLFSQAVFAALVLLATIGGCRPALWLLNATLFLSLSFAVLVVLNPGLLDSYLRQSKVPAPIVMMDITLDIGILVFLCVFAPWPTWAMFLSGAAFSACIGSKMIGRAQEAEGQ